jgi:hypothetical protein
MAKNAQLHIVNADITRIRDGSQSFDTGEIPKLAELSVTFRNDSPSDTIHVSTLLGGFAYSESEHCLEVTFREPDSALSYRTSPFTPPIQDSLMPGETKTLNFTIPLTARVISGPASASSGVRVIDASAVKKVTVAFVYGKSPLRRASAGLQARLHQTTHTFSVKHFGSKRSTSSTGES